MNASRARRRISGFFTQRGLLLMMAPWIVYFIVFHYVPMAGVTLAFKDFTVQDGLFGSAWIGWGNFARLFEGVDFRQALGNTVIISLLRLIFGFAAPIVLALLLNEVRSAGFRKSIQTVTYIPYLLSWVILGGVFLLLFSLDGAVNQLLRLAHVSPVNFLTDDAWFLFILIATGIWQSAGYGAVIYLAALAGISPGLYEAAAIDGASRWQQVRHVTLPSLRPTIVVLFILNLGHVLDAGFDQIYNLYNPLVYDVADILDTYILRRLVSLDLGLSTAAGVFKSVVGLVFLVSANWLAGRLSKGEEGIW
jgi:putative aldouronate transport system permease protein